MTRTRGQPGRHFGSVLAIASTAVFLLAGCDAPVRATVAEICNNHVDDDGNGMIDCLDPACMGKPVCATEICDNNIDDDGDGKFDCADSDCAVLPICGGGNKCGNDMIDPGEDCDGADLGGRTCITQGFQSGTLSCNSCTIDTAACSHDSPENCHNGVDDDHDGQIDCADSDCAQAAICLCGNHMIDGFEACDGALIPDGVTCLTLGFSGGTLACRSDCLSVDTSACTPGACGDGIINSGETCDDGNTTAGDGCDATCQIELAPLCATAKPLLLGVNHFDDSHGTNGFEGSCTGNGSQEEIFTYTPATSGTVTIVLNSMVGLGIYARSACTDTNTELACANPSGNNSSPAINFPVSAGVPVTVFVDGSAFFPPPPPGGQDGGIGADAVVNTFTLIVVQTP